MGENLSIDKIIENMSDNNNYYVETGKGKNKNQTKSGIALKLLLELSEEELNVVLNNQNVINTIMSINDTAVLRAVFRKVPAFFQEKMFENERVQDCLISPRPLLDRKKLARIYNVENITFDYNEIRELENFLQTIKSPKIQEQIIENKFFQRIIALCSYKQIREPFFRGLDVVKLFHNITQDKDIYDTRKPRKRNIIRAFNDASNHILLPDDYYRVLKQTDFMAGKKRRFQNCDKIIVDKKTLSIMTPNMIKKILEYDNIDMDLIVEFLKNDILTSLQDANYNFELLFQHLIREQHNRNRNRGNYYFLQEEHPFFNGVDYVYFRVILEECEKDEELKKRFVDFIYKTLCNNADLDDREKESIKNTLYMKMRTNGISKEDYKKLFYQSDITKTIFYLKFGFTALRMDYLHSIKPEQMLRINTKHINQIKSAIKIENEDELSNIYSYAIKMYLVFGLDRTLKILNGEYGSLDRKFYDNVSSLKVDEVKFKKEGKKFLPIIREDFINFMFAKQDENHFIEMLENKQSKLYKYWSYLYNNFDEIKEKCHGEITLKKVNIILDQLSPTRAIDDVTPDNYKLKENNILEFIVLGNKTTKRNEEVYKNVLDIYEQMKRRVDSSIPYVKGECSNGYSYEMMKLNDPIIFSLGYIGNSCIRTNDIAHNHLLHAALCRNGRVLIIYNEDHEIAGFSPLKRNGEVLIANSIECTHKIRNQKAIEAFSKAMEDIVEKTEKNEEDKTPIRLVCIGSEAYAKPKTTPFPKDITVPTIYEKNDPIYRNTDQYHRKVDIVYKNPNLDLNKLKYGNPKCSYMDPRPPIIFCDFASSSKEEQEKALKIINAVKYANANLDELEEYKISNRFGIQEVIYSEDWYIIVSYFGSVSGCCLNFDKRAKEEYEEYLKKVKSIYAEGQKLSGYDYWKKQYKKF